MRRKKKVLKHDVRKKGKKEDFRQRRNNGKTLRRKYEKVGVRDQQMHGNSNDRNAIY